MSVRVGLLMMMTMLAMAVGCGDGDTGEAAGGDGDSSSAVTMACGDNTCEASKSEQAWGASPCCLPNDECGLEADDPIIVLDPLPSTSVADALQLATMDTGMEPDPAAPDLASMIKEFNPTVSCMARDQDGELDDACPSLDPGAALADADAGVDTGAAADMGFDLTVDGCCRPDGFCGYIDNTDTIGGCVKISESLIGKIFGSDDVQCTP